MNTINVLRWRFRQCLGTFTMLLVEWSTEMELFRHLSTHVFEVRNFRNAKSVRVTFFFSKCSKLNLDFKNVAKTSEKVFCFWYNCIWIGFIELSLLRTGHLSSAANVLTSSPKNWNVNKTDFFQLNYLETDQSI